MVLLIVINVVLIGLGTLCLIFTGAKAAKIRNPKTHCYKCGYYLRGTIEKAQKCPECGFSHKEGRKAFSIDRKVIKDDSKAGTVLIIAAIVIDICVFVVIFIIDLFFMQYADV